MNSNSSNKGSQAFILFFMESKLDDVPKFQIRMADSLILLLLTDITYLTMFIGPTHKEDVPTTQPHKPSQHITRGTGIRMADMRFIIDVINRGRDFIRPDAIITGRGGCPHNVLFFPTMVLTLLGTRCGGRGEQGGGGRDRGREEGGSTTTWESGTSMTRRVGRRRHHHVSATATQGYGPSRQHKCQ